MLPQSSVIEVIYLKKKKIASLPLYWWNGVLTLSQNSLHIPLIGADFIAMFDWQPEVNMKKEGPFLPSTPTTYIEHVIWKFQSLKLLKMYTGRQCECCVYSQCQPMPITAPLPWTSLSQGTTTSYFPSKICNEQSRPRKREQCVQPTISSLSIPPL